MAKSNKSILEHILSYCNEIQTTMLRFGDNLDTFINDIDYRKSVSLSILQIGELAGKLSDEYRQSTTEMPWRQIRGLRNIVAHSYGEVDFEMIFSIAHDDISHLKLFCEQELNIWNFLMQVAWKQNPMTKMNGDNDVVFAPW